MSDLPLLAAAYASFLAGVAALLSRTGARRAGSKGWSRAQGAKLHDGLARTLLVLASFILAVTAATQRLEGWSLEHLGVAAVVVGVAAASRARGPRARNGGSPPPEERGAERGSAPGASPRS